MCILKAGYQHAAGQVNDLSARADHRCHVVVGTNTHHTTRLDRYGRLAQVVRIGREDSSAFEDKICRFVYSHALTLQAGLKHATHLLGCAECGVAICRSGSNLEAAA